MSESSGSQPLERGFRANLDRLNDLREKSAGHSVLKAAAFTIAAFDAMPALTAIAEAAYWQTHGDGGTGGYNPMLHNIGTCKLCDALRALSPEQQEQP